MRNNNKILFKIKQLILFELRAKTSIIISDTSACTKPTGYLKDLIAYKAIQMELITRKNIYFLNKIV